MKRKEKQKKTLTLIFYFVGRVGYIFLGRRQILRTAKASFSESAVIIV